MTFRLVTVLLALLAVSVGLLAPPPPPTSAQGKGQLVIVSWGGSYQEALRKAFFEPFQAETGIRIIEQSPPALAKVKAMVTTGNTEWDLVDSSPSAFFTMVDQKLLEPLDASVDRGAFHEQTAHQYGVGGIFTSVLIGYNTKFYSRDNHPRSWAEFWDVQKFPGPRSLVAGQDGNINAMEVALLADGVPRDKVYPIDTDRAWKSLERIRPHVTKWTTTVAEASQGLADGQFALSMVFSNRVEALKQQGAPVDYEWNDALISWTYWVVPKGAPNKANAMRYLTWLSQKPDAHARLAGIMPVGPVLKQATSMLDAKTLALVPTSPDHVRQGVFYNPTYWAQKTPAGRTNVEEYVARWNAFRLKQ